MGVADELTGINARRASRDDLYTELGVANADDIAVPQVGLLYSLVVNHGTIGAVEVDNPTTFRGAFQAKMTAGDFRVVGERVVRGLCSANCQRLASG